MSVAIKQALQFSPMHYDDLERIGEIEAVTYEFPWTIGNFRDSLNAGYSCWACRLDNELVGYAVVMIAAGEAHLLNISIGAPWQRRGLGGALLGFLLDLAKERHCVRMLLEVRKSNEPARRLYVRNGFMELGVRKGYYPASMGREDAIVFERPL